MRVISRLNVGGPDHRQPSAPDVPGCRVATLGRRVYPTDDLRALLVAAMRRFRSHIVHTHGVLGRIAATTAGVPARVHTFHGHLLHGYFSRGLMPRLRSKPARLRR